MNIALQLTDYTSPKSLGSRFRKKRSQYLKKILIDCHDRYGKVDTIDVGGRPSYWNIFPESIFSELNMSILFINDGDEIAVDEINQEKNPHFKQLEADACDLSQFDNDHFDLCHSNSVIEHVGNWKRMQQFAKETQRVAKHYYLQTPNFGFPIEPHFMQPFFHWLPEPMRAKKLQKKRLGHIGQETDIVRAMDAIQSIQLLNEAMVKGLYPELSLEKERFLGLCKSLIVVSS